MKLHRLAVALVASIGLSSLAMAQSPSVLYTWDHSFGAGAGPNTEGWGYDFGAAGQGLSLSNATDGVLTFTETLAGGDWAIIDNYNGYKESAARSNLSGSFSIGGADFTGLDSIELDISHNGVGTINGQFVLRPAAPGCCGYKTQPISIAPGGPQTISVDLNAFGLTAAEFKYNRTIGFQIFGNSEPNPVTFSLSEIRSAGTPDTSRVIADYAGGGLENVVVKFDNTAINGSTGVDNQAGLSNVGGALRWVDLGNQNGGPSGGAVAWGNNNALAVDYSSRTMDLSNYDFATVRMRATPGAGADPTLGVQFYAQYADRALNNEFAFQSTDLVLPVDNQFYDLVFPISAFVDKDLTQWIGLNLQPHAGNMQIFVQSVVLTQIPEPASLAIVALGAACVAGVRRRA
jgi:hypothetical protein